MANGMSESHLQSRIIDTAQLLGWRVAHFRAARTAKGWRTPLEGDPGFPDLVLARDGCLLAAELKAETGHVSAHQVEWLRHLGDHGRLWRPSDWDDIHAVLRSGPC